MRLTSLAAGTVTAAQPSEDASWRRPDPPRGKQTQAKGIVDQLMTGNGYKEKVMQGMTVLPPCDDRGLTPCPHHSPLHVYVWTLLTD